MPSEMNSSSSHLPLNQYTKDVPPGWDPRDPNFPLRSYISRLKLWSRTTGLRVEQMGPAVAGRLQGRPFDVALQLSVDLGSRPDLIAHYGANALVGDDALAFPGAAADGPNGLPELRSGLAQFIQNLEALYGAQDQKINTQAIDNFEFLIRGPSMSLLEYCNEYAFLYQQANTLAGYEINHIARSHRFIRGSRQPPELVKNVLLLVNQDLRRFEDIYNHFLLIAKQAVDPKLPGGPSALRHGRFYQETEDDTMTWYYQTDGDAWTCEEQQHQPTDYDDAQSYYRDVYYDIGDDDDDYGYDDYDQDNDDDYEWYDDGYSYYLDEESYWMRPKGKGKGRRPKGKGKSKFRRPKGLGKMRRFAMFGGKGKGKKGKPDGKGKPWGKSSPGRSSGMMGCATCGSPNHNSSDCPVGAINEGKGTGKGKGKSYWQEQDYDYYHDYSYYGQRNHESDALQPQQQPPVQPPSASVMLAAASPVHTLFQSSALRNAPRISTASPTVQSPPIHQILDKPADTGSRGRP